MKARRGSLAERAAAVLPDKPILDTARLAEELGCSQAAASGLLSRFAAAGILSRSNLGRRNRVWVARGGFHLLDEFERGALQRPGRRSRVKSPASPPTRMPGPAVSALTRRVLGLVASGATTLADLDEALAGAAARRRIRVSLYGLRDLDLVRLAGRARTARWSATAAGRDALGEDRPPG